ncbi:hypothetical protein [Rhodococcus opacus]|uniref:hypothetical protein n=1 Tax=Rhodococcus opacus TaxID=37919 RepID=UPI0022368E3C|nr:hypothetical protein [Rhodococcus opacus]UZG59662.1 hypothetical protein ONE62_38490 [Rhodococcus opacus]
MTAPGDTGTHGAHIIGIGIHIGIDQPMLCIQLMNMCIMSIICCDIVLTTVVDVSLDTSGTRFALVVLPTVGLFER